MTYLPEPSGELMQALEAGRHDAALAMLEQTEYERVGLDRAYAILADIGRQWGSCEGFRVLDVGCNNALIGSVLAQRGNCVVGVDSGAIDAQGIYVPLRPQSADVQVYREDIEAYLCRTGEHFDFVLLLSVAHQWERGYAQSGQDQKAGSDIQDLMRRLLQRAEKAVYVELPDDEPGFEKGYAARFLEKYLPEDFAPRITRLRDTVATNGYLRAFYRIDKQQREEKREQATELEALIQRYGLDARVELHGNQPPTRWAGVGSDGVLLAMNGMSREAFHIYGTSGNMADRSPLWRLVMELQPAHVMAVKRVFPEGYALAEIVRGVGGSLCVDAPAWNRRATLGCTADRGDFAKNCAWLSQLASGLANLHAMSIAHGDAFSYNAILSDSGAKWIDLSNMSADLPSRQTDVAVFLCFTIPEFLNRTGRISDALLREMPICADGAPDTAIFLRRLAAVFGCERDDVRKQEGGDEIALTEALIDCVRGMFGEDPRLTASLLHAMSSYHTSFLFNHKLCAALQENLDCVRCADRYRDFEQHRLRVSRGELYSVRLERDQEAGRRAELEGECEGMRAQIAALHAEVARKDAESDALHAELARREADNDALRAELAQREADNDALRAELARRNAENGALQSELAERNADCADLRRTLDACNERLDNCRDEVHGVRGTCGAVADELLGLLYAKGYRMLCVHYNLWNELRSGDPERRRQLMRRLGCSLRRDQGGMAEYPSLLSNAIASLKVLSQEEEHNALDPADEEVL